MGALSKFLDIVSPMRPRQLAMSPRVLDVAPTLRGGDNQRVDQLLAQLAGRPGVRKQDLGLWASLDPSERMGGLGLVERARPPKLYAQRSIQSAHDDDVAMTDMAADLVWGDELINDRLDIYLNALEGTDPAAWQRLSRQRPPADDIDALGEYETLVGDVLDNIGINPDPTELNEEFLDRILDMANNQVDQSRTWGPLFKGIQVQSDLPEGSYFETVLRGAPSTTEALASKGNEGYHFANNAQLGHIRGTLLDDTMFLHELQSDPLEVLGATHPAMQNIYGKLGNMAVDRAAAAGMSSLAIPNGERIARMRPPQHEAFYKKLYDDTLNKSLYDPLRNQGLRVSQDAGFNFIDLPEAAREAILRGDVLRYRRGGLAQMCECGK